MLRKVVLSIAVLAVSVLGCTSTDDKKADEELSGAEVTDMDTSGSLGSLTGDDASSSEDVVYFGYDEYTLDGSARAVIEKVAEKLKASDGKTAVRVEGHCDERGSIEYNLALGNRRAEAVKSALVSLGVPASNISTISFGKERPAVEGSDESAWSKNRRAEFVISN